MRTNDQASTGGPPRVSVIMIFLNAERYIAEAIDSVLAQTEQSFELILVDDGSHEPCSSIARDYAARFHPQVRYMDHEGHRNRGMSASRNAGLGVAAGDYVAFLDADDYWAPNKLADQAAIMDAHPELGMVCGTTRYWYSWNGGPDHLVPSGHVQDRVVYPPEASLNVYPLGRAYAPCPSDLMMRKSVVATIDGFEEHFTGSKQMYEDQAFLAKLYLAAPVWFSSAVWLDYRQHPESCVAEVRRQGLYRDVRGYFLEWFERYLSSRPAVDARVIAALTRALWLNRHPAIDDARQTLNKVLARLGRARLKLQSKYARLT